MRRRFNKRPKRDLHRINERIRVPEVRVIDPSGEQIGILPTFKAVQLAKASHMDLVEISAKATPPVCRIIDYGKFKYELAQKTKENKKSSTKTITKEVRFRPKIDDNDFNVKTKQMSKFFASGYKVKVQVQFRGRENAHKEVGSDIVEKVKVAFTDIAEVYQEPKMAGRNLTMILSPIKK